MVASGSRVEERAVFGRILAAVDSSSAGGAARVLAGSWAAQFGAAASVVGIPAGSGRARSVARAIAEAAHAFGADAIVLGLSPERLAYHRLAGGLREELTSSTALPVLVVPVAPTPRRPAGPDEGPQPPPVHATVVPISAARRTRLHRSDPVGVKATVTEREPHRV